MPYLIFYVGTDLNLHCKMATLKGFNSTALERLMSSLIYMSVLGHAERLIEKDNSQSEFYDFYHFMFPIEFVSFFGIKYGDHSTVDISRLLLWISTREIFEHDKISFVALKEIGKKDGF